MEALGSEVSTSGPPPGAAPSIDFTSEPMTSDLAKMTKAKVARDTATADETNRRLESDRSRAENFLSREGVGPNDLQKWDADAERRKYETNPIESFGSLASVFAIMASAFTRTPMENALNGSAAAMNAIKARDDEGYKRAFDAWKVNTDLAIQRHNMMHQNYQDAMTLMSTDLALGEAKMRQEAARYGDQKALFFLEHGMSDELFKMMDARATSMEKMADVREKMTKTAFQDQVFHADPRSHSKDPNEQFQAFQDSRAMDIKTQPDADMYRRIWASDEMKKTPPDQRFKLFDQKWGEYKQATYHGSNSDRTLAPILTDVMNEHPDWPPGQQMIEAQSRMARAKQAAQVLPPEQLSQLGWTPETIDAAARTYNKTGATPHNLGTRNVAATITGAIQKRANELMEADGITAEQRAKNWQKYKAQQVAIQRFESGPQGNTIRSLGVVVDHLATMRHLAEALKNGNTPLFNKIAQEWAEQTGSKVPTNFDEARTIVGAEIIKAIGVAGAGTQSERSEAANAFARWRSPQQLIGGIDDVFRPLMLGQLKGLERQFTQSTGLTHEEFLGLLGPEAEKFMRPDAKKSEEKATPTQADLDYVKAHPEVKEMFIKKFGREP